MLSPFTLKDRVNLLIESARVSKGELARVAGISYSLMLKICSGVAVHITGSTVLRIADACGCTTDWLLGRPVPGPTPAAIRQAIRARGGFLKEREGEPDPINDQFRSRRGRTNGRSKAIPSDPNLPTAPVDDEPEGVDA